MSGTLNFVLLYVEDIAAARAFYTEKIGFTVKSEIPNFVQFEADGAATFALSQASQPTPTTTIGLWWQVADADAIHATLVERQVEITSEPKDEPFGRAFSLKDPEGNIVNFYQPRQG